MRRCRASSSSSSPSCRDGANISTRLQPCGCPSKPRTETSMNLIKRRTVLALALAAGSVGAMAQNKTVNLGVAIPAATHGFTAGIVWWTGEAKKELEKKYPNLKITVKTAANAGE